MVHGIPQHGLSFMSASLNNFRKYVAIGRNFVIIVTDTLDFEKHIIMKLGAMVSQIILWELPG